MARLYVASDIRSWKLRSRLQDLCSIRKFFEWFKGAQPRFNASLITSSLRRTLAIESSA